jgi:hypothetical protein
MIQFERDILSARDESKHKTYYCNPPFHVFYVDYIDTRNECNEENDM